MTTGLADTPPCRSIVDATGWIDLEIARLAPEETAASDALGRVLAEDVTAAVDFPAFDRAAIDGVALRAAETVGASAYNLLGFHLADKADPLPAGSAARVGAGERLPPGADAIVPLDVAQLGAAGTIDIIEAVPPEHGVERKASHFTHRTVLLLTGRCVRAADLGLLAVGSVERVTVVQRPRIAIVLTGRGAEPADAAAEANAAMLRPLLERDGARVVGSRRVDRTTAAIRQAISTAGVDAVLVVGGPDQGCDRETAAVLLETGKLAISEVALNPGGSIVMGRTAGGTLAFSLPDTPSSCFWAYEALIGRAIRRLAGRDPASPFRQREMRLARKIVSMIGVTEICPVQRRDDGSVEPLVGHMRSNLRAVTQADGFVVVAEGSEGVPAGAVVAVHLFDDYIIPRAQSPSGTGTP